MLELFRQCDIYRLMHALFDIKTVIIPRNRYRPEGFSPRVDIGRGMITVLIWKKACINLILFITYFNIELKKNKINFPHRHQTYGYEWSISAFETSTNLSLTFSKRQLTVGRKWRHGAHERLDIVLSEFCPNGRYRCGTSGVYVWAKLTLLLINMW